jgi:hypothetical protein
MEAIGSLLCSKVTATDLCTKPYKSSPSKPSNTIFLKYVLILSPIYASVFQVVCSFQVLPLKVLVYAMRAIYPAHHILLDFFVLIIFSVEPKL